MSHGYGCLYLSMTVLNLVLSCELARCLSLSFSQLELLSFVAVLLILICVMLVCERMFHYPCWEGNYSIVSGSVASSSYIDETQVSVWEVRLPTSSFYKALSITCENQEMLPSSSMNIYWTFSLKRIIIWGLIWEETQGKLRNRTAVARLTDWASGKATVQVISSDSSPRPASHYKLEQL